MYFLCISRDVTENSAFIYLSLFRYLYLLMIVNNWTASWIIYYHQKKSTSFSPNRFHRFLFPYRNQITFPRLISKTGIYKFVLSLSVCPSWKRSSNDVSLLYVSFRELQSIIAASILRYFKQFISFLCKILTTINLLVQS